MKTTFPLVFRGFINPLYLLMLLILLFACEKEISVDEETNCDTRQNESVIVKDITNMYASLVQNSYDGFNKNQDYFAHLGWGLDTITGLKKAKIFKVTSVQPDVKYLLNENYMKQIIVSWDWEKSDSIINRISEDFLGTNAQIQKLLRVKESKINKYLYVDILQINKLGDAEIDYMSDDLNDFLKYNSSLVEGFENDEITISNEEFINTYGHIYNSSISLGTFSRIEFRIWNINNVCGNENHIAAEVISLLEKVLYENADWDDLIENSTYFSNSSISDIESVGTPSGVISFRNDWGESINYTDSLYKEGNLGILYFNYLPYSFLYPTFNFGK